MGLTNKKKPSVIAVPQKSNIVSTQAYYAMTKVSNHRSYDEIKLKVWRRIKISQEIFFQVKLVWNIFLTLFSMKPDFTEMDEYVTRRKKVVFLFSQ